MRAASPALRNERGFATWVFTLYLFAAVYLAFQAALLIARMQAEKTQLAQALVFAEQAAVAQGASITSTGQVSWNTSQAFRAAVQAIQSAFPETLQSSQPTSSASFAPSGPVPPDWTGDLNLVQFQTSSQGGTVTLFGKSTTVQTAYVAAGLTQSVTDTFFGIPLTFQIQVGKITQVYGYNGQSLLQVQ